MAHSVDHLASLIDQTAELLKTHGEEHWADWMEADARAIRARDGWGLEHFLAAFGGSGSLRDLIFHPMNGNAASDAEGRTATERLDELLSEAYPIALDLERELIDLAEDG
ncbi:MAG: hypothetical protein EHM90_01410, partial [Chloroflexi bacterium]